RTVPSPVTERISMSWFTHEIVNQAPDLPDCNLYTSDFALQQAVQREADWHTTELTETGQELGSRQLREVAELANRHAPQLHTYDRVGQRIDTIEFHPAWHQLLTLQRKRNLHALSWTEARAGAHVARTAAYYLQAQLESGSLCPITMIHVAIPLLQQEPSLFVELSEQLFSRTHDARDLPISSKTSIMIGMGMTEKQ